MERVDGTESEGTDISDTTLAVQLIDITKRFPGVIANDGVNLTVADGEIHAICGENGAGKSTLMKILYGMQSADEGRMIVRGNEVSLKSPKEAIDLGIGMVHQHFMLADNFTVLENIILGSEPAHRGIVDRRGATKAIEELVETYGLDVRPEAMVEDLEVGERQRVEILKVLYRGAKILILDEPTAVLVPQEIEELFRNLRDLKAQGHTIIFIDHKLDEVLEISDTITVIRQGKTVATVDPKDVTAHDLAELMVGSELPTPETRESTVTDVVVLELAGLSTVDQDREIVHDIDLQVRHGEIVGIAGVEGNGQNELIETLLGMRRASAGTVILDGRDITNTSVRGRRELGIDYIPADRHRFGLMLDAPLWENAMLGHQSEAPFVNGIWIDRKAARAKAQEIIDEFDVRTPGIDTPAHALSGGNQQKFIIGREMITEPSLLVAAHPTRGIDVGAQAAVWEQLRIARAAGLAVLLVSADLDELIGLSDVLHVMLRGELVAELDPAEITPRELGSYMTGAAVGAPE